MRPRIKVSRGSVAGPIDRNKSDLTKDSKGHQLGRPYVMVFGRKLYISPEEIEEYCDQGFTVYQSKQL